MQVFIVLGFAWGAQSKQVDNTTDNLFDVDKLAWMQCD